MRRRQVESRAIILLPPSHHRTFYAVLPGDRRLHGMKEVNAFFVLKDASAGSVVDGLYGRLLPHVNLAQGDHAVSCSSCDGSNPRASSAWSRETAAS